MTSFPKASLTLFVLLAAAAAHASNTGTTSSIVGVQNSSGIDYHRSECAGCVDQGANTDTSDHGTSTITAYAAANYGVLKAAVSATGQGTYTIARVNATSVFGDQFEIDAAGFSGQQGYFKAQVTMPFTASVSLEPETVGSLTAFVKVNEIESWSETFGSANGAAITSIFHNGIEQAIGTPMILDVPFVYGQPITILGFLDIQVEGELRFPGGSFDGAVDAAHSLYWHGFSEITDGRGNRVTDYTITSESGTNWSRDFSPSPVPEPASGALWVAGLVLVAVRRRMNRSQCTEPETGRTLGPL